MEDDFALRYVRVNSRAELVTLASSAIGSGIIVAKTKQARQKTERSILEYNANPETELTYLL